MARPKSLIRQNAYIMLKTWKGRKERFQALCEILHISMSSRINALMEADLRDFVTENGEETINIYLDAKKKNQNEEGGVKVEASN